MTNTSKYFLTFRSAIILAAILYIFSFSSMAQEQPKTGAKGKTTTTQSNTKIADNDFKDIFLDATDLFNNNFYDDALPSFVKLVAMEPDNANVNFYAGACIINSRKQLKKAIPYLEKAALNTNASYNFGYKEKSAPIEALLFLGKAYQFDGQYEKALASFNKLKSLITTKPKDAEYMKDVNRLIEMATNAQALVAKPVKVNIEPWTMMNSEFSDYSPVMASDGYTFYFSSRRKGSIGGQKDANGEFYPDIYFSTFKSNKWTKPQKMGAGINSIDMEDMNCISADGSQLYFSRSAGTNYDIYVSQLSPKGKWMPAQKLGSGINTKSNERWAYISADGNSLLFSSDRPGGYGGYDIYIAQKNSAGGWDNVKNLGSDINTAYDEICPVLMPDGTLYFSSNGHNTMGGFDVFKSKSPDNETWLAPENMGCPINTPYDDYNFYPTTPDGKKGYYTTAKKGGYLESDIYKFSFE